MAYTIVILRRAQRELAVLPQEAYKRVRDAIRKLGEEPRPPGCAKLRTGWKLGQRTFKV